MFKMTTTATVRVPLYSDWMFGDIEKMHGIRPTYTKNLSQQAHSVYFLNGVAKENI